MDHYLQRAIKGDANAIVFLIEQDEEQLYNIAYSYMKNEDDTLDVMQDLTYKALKKMHTVKKPEFARTWLIRVLINCCYDALKKRLKNLELEEQHATFTPSYDEISILLKALPQNEQQLIYAKYFQQLKNNEIATIHSIPEGTVKSKLHHILRKLRKNAGAREDWF